MVLLSQTAQEFYETDQAEKIIGMCPIKVFHKLPDLDEETADKIGLTREQRKYVRGADAGKEDLGYSQALVRVEEHGTYPLHVVADEFEKRVIDYEPDDREFIQQAISAEPEEFVTFEEFVENEARRNALTNRFDLSEAEATRLLEDGLSQQEVVDAVVAQTFENRSKTARADGGRSPTESNRTDTTTEEDDHV
jgi:hypothetical protein